MINKTARKAFEDHLKSAMSMSPRHELAAEYELGWAAGLVAYAFFNEDIGHTEVALLQKRIQAVRSRRVVMRCQETRAEAS